MALQAGRKGVNPEEVNNRGFLRNVLRNMKIKIAGNVATPGSDGYVNIPLAENDKIGLFKPTNYYAMGINSSGNVFAGSLTYEQYQNKEAIIFVSKGTLNNVFPVILKNILTNTGTNVWTDTERLAVLSRLGCSVDSETGAVTWIAQE